MTRENVLEETRKLLLQATPVLMRPSWIRMLFLNQCKKAVITQDNSKKKQYRSVMRGQQIIGRTQLTLLSRDVYASKCNAQVQHHSYGRKDKKE
jgi:hypothetical protein